MKGGGGGGGGREREKELPYRPTPALPHPLKFLWNMMSRQKTVPTAMVGATVCVSSVEYFKKCNKEEMQQGRNATSKRPQ
jgi:hypothetical protein